MRVIDADGHVNECPATFDDKYLDPAFRSRRPAIVGSGGLFYWMIGEQVFPRRSGLGCNNFSTPARIDGKPTRHGALIEGRNLDTLDSQELTDLNARLEALDAEDIDVPGHLSDALSGLSADLRSSAHDGPVLVL